MKPGPQKENAESDALPETIYQTIERVTSYEARKASEVAGEGNTSLIEPPFPITAWHNRSNQSTPPRTVYDNLHSDASDNLRDFSFFNTPLSPTRFNESDDIPSSLHAAARTNNVTLALSLLVENADPNILNENGETPLHIAASNNSLNVARALILGRADPNIKSTFFGQYTPFHIAVRNSNEELVNDLLRANANIEACDEYGNTALHIAAAYSDLRILISILERKPQIKTIINAVNNGNYTPLHVAAYYGRLYAVMALINKGASALDVVRDDVNALVIALEREHQHVVEFILDEGVILPERFKKGTLSRTRTLKHRLDELLDNPTPLDSADSSGSSESGESTDEDQENLPNQRILSYMQNNAGQYNSAMPPPIPNASRDPRRRSAKRHR